MQFTSVTIFSTSETIATRVNYTCKSSIKLSPGKSAILGLQPRDKAAMLVVNTKETFLLNLHQNRVHFPAERNAFVLDPQHGHRDVTCKPAIRGFGLVYLNPNIGIKEV